MTTIDWNKELFDQLDWHWQHHLRPRLDGLSDAEYFWEPVPGCWSVRRRPKVQALKGTQRREDADPALLSGSGEYSADFTYPEPTPPPVTTIAWRLAHVIVGIFGARNASHFGGPPVSYDSFPYAGTAAEALRQLDEGYDAWSNGVRKLGQEGLARPCGPAEGPFADAPMGALVLHINREAIHHGAEVLVLRDLYRARPAE